MLIHSKHISLQLCQFQIKITNMRDNYQQRYNTDKTLWKYLDLNVLGQLQIIQSAKPKTVFFISF